MKGWQKEYFFSASPELAGSIQAINVLKSFLSRNRGAKRPPWPSMEKKDPEGQAGIGSLWSTGGSTGKYSAQVLGVVKHIHTSQELLLHLLQVWAQGEGHRKGWWPTSAWEGCFCCRWLQVKQGRYYIPLGKPDTSPGESGASSGRKHSTGIEAGRMCEAPPSEHVLGTGPPLPCGLWSLHAQYRNSLVCGPGFGDEKWICSQEKSLFVGRKSVSWVPQGHSVWKSQMIKR